MGPKYTPGRSRSITRFISRFAPFLPTARATFVGAKDAQPAGTAIPNRGILRAGIEARKREGSEEGPDSHS